MVKIATPEFSYNVIPPQLENLTEEDFFHFCLQNKHIHIERDENQQILFLPPEGIQTSATNANIGAFLAIWNMNTRLGVSFGTSAGFTLPDGGMRSPDAAWMNN